MRTRFVRNVRTDRGTEKNHLKGKNNGAKRRVGLKLYNYSVTGTISYHRIFGRLIDQRKVNLFHGG